MYENPNFSQEPDRRLEYLNTLLIGQGYPVLLAKPLLQSDLSAAAPETQSEGNRQMILLPIPVPLPLLARLEEILHPNHIILGGGIAKEFKDFCAKNDILCIDALEAPETAMANAVATAEGAIWEAMQLLETTLQDCHALVIGYGKCGEVLADRLSNLCGSVTVSTRNSLAQARAKAHGFPLLGSVSSYGTLDLIFNTAPALVLTRERIDRLKKDAVIIDIASAPGGTDFHYCAQKGIRAKLCNGLPGKYAPKSAARILFDQIQKELKKR